MVHWGWGGTHTSRVATTVDQTATPYNQHSDMQMRRKYTHVAVYMEAIRHADEEESLKAPHQSHHHTCRGGGHKKDICEGHIRHAEEEDTRGVPHQSHHHTCEGHNRHAGEEDTLLALRHAKEEEARAGDPTAQRNCDLWCRGRPLPDDPADASNVSSAPARLLGSRLLCTRPHPMRVLAAQRVHSPHAMLLNFGTEH